MAGSPKIAISPAKNTKSNTAKTTNKLPNDGVKSNLPRSLIRNHTLKMFTSTPNVATVEVIRLYNEIILPSFTHVSKPDA